MQEEIYHRMYGVEDRHWWFSAKRRIIRDLLRRYARRSGEGPIRVADIGCGCGRGLEEMPEGVAAVGIDCSRTAIEFCRRRGVDARYGMLPDDLPLEAGSFDAAVLADALEHIEDDAAAAKAVARLLAPGGVMIVTVPALPSLWTSWDELHGHKRRYTKSGLTRVLTGAGLAPELMSFYNTFLFPPAVAGRMLRRLARRNDTAELKIPTAFINAALEKVFASERYLLGRVPIPIGLSLVAVMRKP